MSEELEAKIQSLNKGDFVRLLELIPLFQMNPDFGKMVEGKKESAEETIPYYAPSQLVSDFLTITNELGIIVNFDWIKWKEGVALLENPNSSFASQDIATLCKLLTAIIKNDRFTEGYLLSKCQDGTILKILLAIESKFA